MKRLIVAGLVALAAACTSEDPSDPPIQYGAPQSPTYTEQGAAGSTQTTLSGSLTFQATSTPEYGAPGLADQLLANLGGYSAAKAMPTPRAAKLASGAAFRAIDTGGIDPACVTTTATSVTWTGCADTMIFTDPSTGATTTSVTVTVDGTMSWNAGTGTTTWSIHETMDMWDSSDGVTVSMTANVDLAGSLTVTASTIAGSSTSTVWAHTEYAGFSFNEGYVTTLALDLGYQAQPFCVTSGSLVLEQRWTERPMGMDAAALPNQGWRFDWTGCGQFTVAHGT